MEPGQKLYRDLDQILTTTFAGPAGFNEQVQASPVSLTPGVLSERTSRLSEYRQFFATVLDIFRDVVNGRTSELVRNLLLNDVPVSYGPEFHLSLPSEVWTQPSFFRTDESKNGKVLELQCPGSGWGDLHLLRQGYLGLCPSEALVAYDPAKLVAEEIIALCGKPHPSVLHLLDNASNPSSMRLLMAATQPPLRYWSFDRSVRGADCDFVRSHSFLGLVSENLFKKRLISAADGKVHFDLPPIMVFDQKAPLCLPFLDETKDRFSDRVRELLAFSYPVTDKGFEDENGDWVGIAEFLQRSERKRKYFLKYAGFDVSLNWGSRAVYRLDDREARQHLDRACADALRGSYWLIQPEISEKERVSMFRRSDGERLTSALTAKYSCFYGPTTMIGIRSMHRHHYKVHGQEDTVLGLAVPRL
jgi:hypothetical protein